MKGKGVLLIGFLWSLLNLAGYLLFDVTGLLIVNWSCIAIIWFGRKKLIKALNI